MLTERRFRISLLDRLRIPLRSVNACFLCLNLQRLPETVCDSRSLLLPRPSGRKGWHSRFSGVTCPPAVPLRRPLCRSHIQLILVERSTGEAPFLTGGTVARDPWSTCQQQTACWSAWLQAMIESARDVDQYFAHTQSINFQRYILS